jgi:hypothetical protein
LTHGQPSHLQVSHLLLCCQLLHPSLLLILQQKQSALQPSQLVLQTSFCSIQLLLLLLLLLFNLWKPADDLRLHHHKQVQTLLHTLGKTLGKTL